MPAIFLILVCVAGVVLSLLLFGAWLIISIFRVIGAGIESVFHPTKTPSAALSPDSPSGWACPRAMCRTTNPSHARFCRRCGRAVAGEPVKARMALASM